MYKGAAASEQFWVVGFAEPMKMPSVANRFIEWPPHVVFLGLQGFRQAATTRMQEELCKRAIGSMRGEMRGFNRLGPDNEPAIWIQDNARMHYVRNRLRSVALQADTQELDGMQNFAPWLRHSSVDEFQEGSLVTFSELHIVNATRGALQERNSVKQVISKLTLV